MNNYLFLIYTFVISFLLFSCTRDKIEIAVPTSHIQLSAPLDNASFDLDQMDVSTYAFSWNELPESGSTLVLSKSKQLLDPLNIDVGQVTQWSISADQMDQYLSTFGFQSGQVGTIYWTVKPSAQLKYAAADIRSLQCQRMSSRLLKPLDQSILQLDGAEPQLPVHFSWSVEGISSEPLQIWLGTSPDFSKKIAIDVDFGSGADITHQQLQDALDALGYKKYTSGSLYWNIYRVNEQQLLSRSSSNLSVLGMMILLDKRGPETIRYQVTRITYPDGTSLVWMAENLRTRLYPDGTSIEPDLVNVAPNSLGADFVKRYGAYYNDRVKVKAAPTGWRLPTVAEFEKLFYEASLVAGRFGVLKDSIYYENFDRSGGNANSWGLGLVSAGQWQGGSVVNHKSVYCYLHAADVEPWKCVLHDGGATLWYPWTDAATARYILEEK